MDSPRLPVLMDIGQFSLLFFTQYIFVPVINGLFEPPPLKIRIVGHTLGPAGKVAYDQLTWLNKYGHPFKYTG